MMGMFLSSRQVYLGGYDDEDAAAEAYDVAALKCKGSNVKTNFDLRRYADFLICMDSITLEELIMAVRRQSQVCLSCVHHRDMSK